MPDAAVDWGLQVLDLSRFSEISECYEVEKTVEVVMEIGSRTETFRIDALKHELNGRIRYCSRVRILRKASVEADGNTNIMSEVWSSYAAPWTDEDSADQAIVHQLMLMKE